RLPRAFSLLRPRRVRCHCVSRTMRSRYGFRSSIPRLDQDTAADTGLGPDRPIRARQSACRHPHRRTPDERPPVPSKRPLSLRYGYASRIILHPSKCPLRCLMSDDQQAEIERLRAENERLKKTRDARLAMKVSEKGALSVYGMGRFPVTLYKEQWLRLLAMAEDIKSFIEANND